MKNMLLAIFSAILVHKKTIGVSYITYNPISETLTENVTGRNIKKSTRLVNQCIAPE